MIVLRFFIQKSIDAKNQFQSKRKGDRMPKSKRRKVKRTKEPVKFNSLAKYDADNNLIDEPVTYSKKVIDSHTKAWTLARAMMEVHEKSFDRSLCNVHVYCKECNQEYCLGFDGVDQFCRDCFYKNCCQKECTGGRTCQHCKGGKA
jgi:hypothetical protein